MTEILRTGPDGIRLMHQFEGCKLRAYPDPASSMFREMVRDGVDPYHVLAVPDKYRALSGNPWTIGYGETQNVRPGMQISLAEADRLFQHRLSKYFEPAVEDLLQMAPTQREFDAFVSLAYNIGVGNFRSSSALRKFNQDDKEGAAAAIELWNKAQGKVMLGLRRRRKAEALVFLGKPAGEAIIEAMRLS